MNESKNEWNDLKECMKVEMEGMRKRMNEWK